MSGPERAAATGTPGWSKCSFPVTVPGEPVGAEDPASAAEIDPIETCSQGTTPGILGAARPEYVATNCATASACAPTTMFCGMISPEKPPFSIAYRTRVTGRSQRTSKFGPLMTAQYARSLRIRASPRTTACGSPRSAG